MKWQSLISMKTSKLAWRRINTGRNLQYKRFFRESYLVYESGGPTATSGSFTMLLPRKHGYPTMLHDCTSLSPLVCKDLLSLLGIEDQIVLQAIANQFRHKAVQEKTAG